MSERATVTAEDDADDWPRGEGNGVVVASWAGTTVFAATTALGAAASQTDILALIVSVLLFVAGIACFFVAFAAAVGRSRTEEIGVMNLFFLDHSAPRPVRRSLLASLAVEIAVALAAAAARPNTSLAFGILVPVYGIGMAGLYGARHGRFPTRQAKPPKAAGRKGKTRRN
jgi:hypothetical protein